jgi:hypothetical protein
VDIPGERPDFEAIAAGEQFARDWCRVLDEREAWLEEHRRRSAARYGRGECDKRHRRRRNGNHLGQVEIHESL